jgi:ribosomal protein S28E/S33
LVVLHGRLERNLRGKMALKEQCFTASVAKAITRAGITGNFVQVAARLCEL